ncbi:MAG: Holliday junction resolvase RuvX [Burkholderiaceae bacterium]|nr:Holliday junction resolvase RuvX [Burkholderiaceae bacterium]MCD8517843.1 Holliday junction resolvase RuvX [Burkholderiaceae bacterium]MCD8535971.1 Holliday junction resolvase RuvX [Burkholderiaceae bacterium]MCD8564617.1 Holliday junction resolvase RuvX [Burkholderiaceae bacterium]
MPDERTILAFDYGTKRLGVALGNVLISSARPLEIIDTPEKVKRFARIEELIVQWQPDMLVVGLPLTESGGEQIATRQAKRFANQLEGRYGLPVALVDERGSSLAAQEIVGNAPDDAAAAAIILQRYFDALPRQE